MFSSYPLRGRQSLKLDASNYKKVILIHVPLDSDGDEAGQSKNMN